MRFDDLISENSPNSHKKKLFFIFMLYVIFWEAFKKIENGVRELKYSSKTSTIKTQYWWPHMDKFYEKISKKSGKMIGKDFFPHFVFWFKN